MIYNFAADIGDETVFGLVTANSIEEAEAFVFGELYRDECQGFEISPGAEDLINEQYGGLAFLTTEPF